MANKPASKGKQPAKKSADTESVVRIKATDTKSSKKVVETTAEKPKKVASTIDTDDQVSRNPLVAIGGYFKGSWYELRQVRWPDRKSTWSLTGAVLLFTAFFIVVILLLDALFKYVFQLILG